MRLLSWMSNPKDVEGHRCHLPYHELKRPKEQYGSILRCKCGKQWVLVPECPSVSFSFAVWRLYDEEADSRIYDETWYGMRGMWYSSRVKEMNG